MVVFRFEAKPCRNVMSNVFAFGFPLESECLSLIRKMNVQHGLAAYLFVNFVPNNTYLSSI
uniref:Uncharacterized protein n=1 Tax=Kalanchoe fedtschenkoi TaxID=63787 RepID=A0A7N0TVC8_KALFE